MICDLSGDLPFQKRWILWLNEIAEETRKPLVDLVDAMSCRNSDNLSWICSPIACRNPYASPFFSDVYLLLLALRIADEENDLTEIILPGKALATVLRRELGRRGKNDVRVVVRARPLSHGVTLRLVYRVLAACYHLVARFVSSHAAKLRAMDLPRAPVVLVETFVYSDSFSGGFRDRHYPGLLEFFDEREGRAIYFVPTFYKIKNYFRSFREIRRSGVQFLVKDAFLAPGDYLAALRDALRVPDPARGVRCHFVDMDISEVLSEAVNNSRATSGLLEGLLNYRFIRRIKEAGLDIRLALDWFENHELDKGFNAAFRRYYPEADSIGYQGFVVSRDYLCVFPTAQDRAQQWIPKRVAVMGTELTGVIREFCPGLDVFAAPALRFAAVWRPLPEREDDGTFRILVALPIFERDARELMKVLCAAVRMGQGAAGVGRKWRIWLKEHPASRGLSWDDEVAMDAEPVTGPFQSVLERADVLVSNTSSVCLESVARGVPVIIVGGRYGVTHNPIPDSVPHDIWALCFDAEEVCAALERFSALGAPGRRARLRSAEEARARYFEPVCADSVRGMLGFPPAGENPAPF